MVAYQLERWHNTLAIYNGFYSRKLQYKTTQT